MNGVKSQSPKKRISSTVFLILIASMLVCAGCDSSWQSKSTFNFNGHLTITRTINGVKRQLETRDPVKFENGKIVQLPKGATVRLSEHGKGQAITAELREQEGKPELWMNTNGTSAKGTDADLKWLDNFLEALEISDSN